MDILDFWPFEYNPRPNQVTALNWLAEQDKPILLLEAPVGSGKSNIGIAYSQYLTQKPNGIHGQSFILTPQRILQEQYEVSMQDNPKIKLASFYGKTNYKCQSKGATCDVGSIVKPTCGNCPFMAAKIAAKEANDTVLNYKLALLSFAYTKTFSHRKLMVLDECHTLENHLVDFDSVAITDWRCKKYKIQFRSFKDMKVAVDWLADYYLDKIKEVKVRLQAECEPLMEKDGRKLTRSELRKIMEFNGIVDHYGEVYELQSRTPDYLTENFVLTWDKTKNEFKRLTGAYSFHRNLVPMADRFLFMSSTILDREGTCQDLGISEDDAAFLSLPSEFPEKNRMVFFMPQTKMNAKWKEPDNENGRKKMKDSIIKLLNMHTGETGIIHTGNYQIATWVTKQLEGNVPQEIFQHNPESGDDRNEAINGFIGYRKPAVLISPSITEGLDLKEDLARFAIIVKVPFGFLGDQWIKRRMEMSIQWYQRRALIDIIQGGGRIVRSEDDWGNVYVLDQSWAFLYKRAFHMIPRWWRDAYEVV